jgi:hypothetical protein
METCSRARSWTSLPFGLIGSDTSDSAAESLSLGSTVPIGSFTGLLEAMIPLPTSAASCTDRRAVVDKKDCGADGGSSVPIGSVASRLETAVASTSPPVLTPPRTMVGPVVVGSKNSPLRTALAPPSS